LTLTGTDEELKNRKDNFSDHLRERESERLLKNNRRQDLEEDLKIARKDHVQAIAEQGELFAAAKVRLFYSFRKLMCLTELVFC
jgi:hypothetical protein